MNLSAARLPAEWEQQQALLLCWPTEQSDWRSKLDAIRAEYRALIDSILKFEPVWLLVPPATAESCARPDPRPGLEFIEARTNDTWCRDYGPITLSAERQRLALDFHFNGWGGRFEARLDNYANTVLSRHPLFETFLFRQVLLELEGGAIECDGQGTVMINRYCLRRRAPHLSDDELDFELRQLLNARHVISIEAPPLPGDDTDGHIDTLARFASPEHIVFQCYADTNNTRQLTTQLESLHSTNGGAYRLTALPAATDLNPDIAASYANFILINSAVIVPQFGSRFDQHAMEILSDVFTDREIVAVDASVLVTQGGGPHCASMQIPALAA